RASAEELSVRLASVLPRLTISVCDSVAAAVRDADIVCLATTSHAALVEASGVRSDAHLNALGAFRPDMRELGVSVLAAADLVSSDDPHGALGEAGDLMEAVARGALDPDSIIDLGALDGRYDRTQCH